MVINIIISDHNRITVSDYMLQQLFNKNYITQNLLSFKLFLKPERVQACTR